MAVMIVLGGSIAALRTPADIFPNIPVPVVAIAWSFTGLSPEDMAGRILTPYRRTLTTTVNDIEHIEAQALPGLGILKVFFQPGADIRLANAQITAVSQTLLRQLPTGTTPPLILNYNASTVPILQIALGGQGMT
jgi:multidrug efflux pump subunit AcrB